MMLDCAALLYLMGRSAMAHVPLTYRVFFFLTLGMLPPGGDDGSRLLSYRRDHSLQPRV